MKTKEQKGGSMEDGIVDIEKVKKIKKIMPSDDLLFDIEKYLRYLEIQQE